MPPLAAQESTPVLGGGTRRQRRLRHGERQRRRGGDCRHQQRRQRGNAAAVGDSYGAVWVDGGDVANSTTVGITADSGTAVADASGGSYNIAFRQLA